jgi:CMP-N-acetylneuraminic acid synthetase
MKMKPDILFLITARGGYKRVSGKNLKHIGDLIFG